MEQKHIGHHLVVQEQTRLYGPDRHIFREQISERCLHLWDPLDGFRGRAPLELARVRKRPLYIGPEWRVDVGVTSRRDDPDDEAFSSLVAQSKADGDAVLKLAYLADLMILEPKTRDQALRFWAKRGVYPGALAKGANGEWDPKANTVAELFGLRNHSLWRVRGCRVNVVINSPKRGSGEAERFEEWCRAQKYISVFTYPGLFIEDPEADLQVALHFIGIAGAPPTPDVLAAMFEELTTGRPIDNGRLDGLRYGSLKP